MSGGFKKPIIDVVTTSDGLVLTVIEIVERRDVLLAAGRYAGGGSGCGLKSVAVWYN